MKETFDNVFEALGFEKEESQSLRIKSQLMLEIQNLVNKRGYSRRELEKKLDVPQPRVSELMTGKIDKFSLEKLVGFIDKIGGLVEVKVKEDRRKAG